MFSWRSGFGGSRSDDGGGFFVEVAEEVVKSLVDLDVHIESGMHLDGIQFHVNATTEKYDADDEKRKATHKRKFG